MSIGYACLTIGVQNAQLRSCTKKYADETNLLEIIEHNLNSLETIIEYNHANGIRLFRISSDLIPFGSSEINNLPWWEIFSDKLGQIGQKIQEYKIRVSMHPGQYTVLNSPNEEVVARAVEDLNYHTKVLDSLGVGAEHKIILHIGGIYQDKQEAIKRFICNYKLLELNVTKRLVIENDDKSYNIQDVLEIGRLLSIPVIFDNLHHKVNPCSSMEDLTEVGWINECKKIWRQKDGVQKIHYSQQNPNKSRGSHSETISIQEFMEFYQGLNRDDIDIMLEVKDKNLSAVKCNTCTSVRRDIKSLEVEWSKYKYSVLEKSVNHYKQIRGLLKEKQNFPAVPFYQLIEEALKLEGDTGSFVNAAQHIWGYFKEKATEKEKNTFLVYVEKFQQGNISIERIKKFLWKLTLKYEETYLLNSYYFILY